MVDRRYSKTLINAEYEKDNDDPQPNTITITMDYKQNIAIGNQSLETGAVFREKSARTILGFYVVTAQTRTYVDYVSDHKNHTGWFVKQCLKHLFNTPWIQQIIEKENIWNCIFWSDNAGHFHNQMLMYYCLSELLYGEHDGTFLNVKYKFFAANHGKSHCDSHFGKISYYYQLYTSTQKAGIHTTQQLCDMIQGMMNQRHKSRMEKLKKAKKKPANYEREKQTQFVAVNFDISKITELSQAQSNQIELQYRLTIPDVKSFGYFESEYDEEMSEAYEQFHIDQRYHIKYSNRNSTEYRLRLKREICKYNKRASVAYNLGLVTYKHSGHMIELILNDNPSTDPNESIKLSCHYSIDIIPKPVETTKNHVEDRATDIKELVRSKTARERVRNNASNRAISNHNK